MFILVRIRLGLRRKLLIESTALEHEAACTSGQVEADYTRECLAIEVDQGIGGEKVTGVLGRIAMERGTPKTIRVDNGPEFVSKVLDQWAYRNGVTLDFSRPGKPTDNAYVESFNGSLQDECLNVNWFLSLEDARRKIEAWRRRYNESSPHTALGDVPPRPCWICKTRNFRSLAGPKMGGPAAISQSGREKGGIED
jgi:putative transposase